MGLLTDPRAGTGKIIKLLLKWEKPLCFVLYIGGVIWLMLLALPAFNDNTYFSENALLPGLVTKESNLEQTSKQYYHELIHEMKRYPDSMPYAWLSAKFSQLHLDVFVHNFSLIYPFQEQKFAGQNIYGIVRAPRASSTEAIVVSVPYRPINSIYLDTAPSVALLLAFAKFCRKQKYWAKDIIFLVTEHEQLGMQAWLDAYHGVTSGQEGIVIAGDLSGRAGSIQAAINLEFHAMKITSIDVKIEGLNGQLPNLDLFNLAQNMIAKEGIRQSFQRRFDVNYRDKLKSWWYHFNTLMSMVATQATGVPTGNHGLFHRFGIEAITLEGFKKSIILLITPHHDSASRFRCSQYIAWIMLHPFVSSAIVVMGYTYLNFPADPIPSLFLRGYRANKQALVFSIVDSMIYGNWLIEFLSAQVALKHFQCNFSRASERVLDLTW